MTAGFFAQRVKHAHIQMSRASSTGARARQGVMPGDHAGPRIFVTGHANGVDAMSVALHASIPTTSHLDAMNPLDG
eukprot:6329792-Pyramimonas_sp.AAC.1